MRLISLSILALLLPLGTLAASTTASLFFGYPDLATTPALTGYVLAANPTATTYILNCLNFYGTTYCGHNLTVTAGPSWQQYSASTSSLGTASSGFSISVSCTFTGTTDGTCIKTKKKFGETVTQTVEYDPMTAPPPSTLAPGTWPTAPPVVNVTATGKTFPGFVKVMITEGAEKLGATATTTTVASTGTVTGAKASSQSTGKASSGARSTPSMGEGVLALALGLLGYGVVGIAAAVLYL